MDMVDMIGLKKCADDMGLTAEQLTEMLLHKLQFLEKYPKFGLLMDYKISREDAESDPATMDLKITKDMLVDIFTAASTIAAVTKSRQFKWDGFVDDGWQHTTEDIYPALAWIISKNIGYDSARDMVEKIRKITLGEKS